MQMYIFGVTMCALVVIFGGMAIVADRIFAHLFGEIEEDLTSFDYE